MISIEDASKIALNFAKNSANMPFPSINEINLENNKWIVIINFNYKVILDAETGTVLGLNKEDILDKMRGTFWKWIR